MASNRGANYKYGHSAATSVATVIAQADDEENPEQTLPSDTEDAAPTADNSATDSGAVYVFKAF
ncbi:MAG: hypothetical protein NZL89_03590 [Leptospiraceae bacterium]|nr:hypothetical protein [Leptospiraceae bacterium]